jgi:hypothetical protein
MRLVMALVGLGISVCGQTSIATQWAELKTPIGDIRALVPCRMDERSSSTLLGGTVYTNTCETERFRASLSVKKHLKPLDSQTANQTFDAIEFNLKLTFPDAQGFEKHDVSVKSGIGRQYILRLKEGNEVREYDLITQFGTVSTMIGTKGRMDESALETMAEKFFDSVEVVAH